eukprot:g1245.t1
MQFSQMENNTKNDEKTTIDSEPFLSTGSQPWTKSSLGVAFRDVKDALLDDIKNEVIEEMKGQTDAINRHAVDHIHANEIILTFGYDETVISFLQHARKKVPRFFVFIAESAPGFDGQRTALALADASIEATVLADASIFSVMARINKVIVGTHAVLADGGLLAPSGLHMIALAARHYKVPLLVTTGLYKLCPQYRHDQKALYDLVSPSAVLSYNESENLCSSHIEGSSVTTVPRDLLDVAHPAFDYVPPDLVSLFITNQQGAQPSYVYRLVSECYNNSDHDFNKGSGGKWRTVECGMRMIRTLSDSTTN